MDFLMAIKVLKGGGFTLIVMSVNVLFFFPRWFPHFSSHIMIYHVKSEGIVFAHVWQTGSPQPHLRHINVLKLSLDIFEDFSAHGIHVHELLSQCHEHSLLSQDCLRSWKSLMSLPFLYVVLNLFLQESTFL